VVLLTTVTYQNLCAHFCGSNYLPGQNIFLLISAILSERTVTRLGQNYACHEHQNVEREDSETCQHKRLIQKKFRVITEDFLSNQKVSDNF